MAIPEHFRNNFQTLLRAAADNAFALIEGNDAATGEPRYVLCAAGRDQGNYVMTPFGHLADGNPYEVYLPPDVPDGPEGGTNPASESPAAPAPSSGTRRKGGRRSP